jgi:hypothetical protein
MNVSYPMPAVNLKRMHYLNFRSNRKFLARLDSASPGHTQTSSVQKLWRSHETVLLSHVYMYGIKLWIICHFSLQDQSPSNKNEKGDAVTDYYKSFDTMNYAVTYCKMSLRNSRKHSSVWLLQSGSITYSVLSWWTLCCWWIQWTRWVWAWQVRSAARWMIRSTDLESWLPGEADCSQPTTLSHLKPSAECVSLPWPHVQVCRRTRIRCFGGKVTMQLYLFSHSNHSYRLH